MVVEYTEEREIRSSYENKREKKMKKINTEKYVFGYDFEWYEGR